MEEEAAVTGKSQIFRSSLRLVLSSHYKHLFGFAPSLTQQCINTINQSCRIDHHLAAANLFVQSILRGGKLNTMRLLSC